AFINIGVISGLLPFTGVALPFISAGGSALVVSLMGVGLLLSVSQGRRGKRKGYRRANLDRWWRNGGARLSRSGRRAGSR
ncbi:MAG TPA: putative lipid II flippase FtsW, partial [Anaerolineae bacterium]|nr:putative lipid II flippase FtsW [Anaerolineae bacterium]